MNNDGIYFNLFFNPINGFSSSLNSGCVPSTSFESLDCSFKVKSLFTMSSVDESTNCEDNLRGRRNTPQKAIASKIGTTIIISIVSTGVTPSEIRPAYEREPITPAPPVPDDHVDITFLK